MKELRKPVLLAVLTVCSIAFAGQDAITLHKSLKEGTEAYHSVSNSKLTITTDNGDQDVAFSSEKTYKLKIGTIDASGNSAAVELTSKVDKFEPEGELAQVFDQNKDQILKETTVKGTLDSRNRFTPIRSGDPSMSDIIGAITSNGSSGFFVEFPEKPVKVGDTWDMTVPKGLITGKDDQKLTAKLESQKQIDGKDAYVISLVGTIKTSLDLGELAKDHPNADLGMLAQVNLSMTGSVDIKGEAVVDKETGQTLSMTTEYKAKQEMSVGGQTAKATGTGKETITLAK